MRIGAIGTLIAAIGVIVAICAWLFPFHPVGPSPFDKTTTNPNPPSIERRNEQTSQPEVKQIHPQKQPGLQAVINDPDGYTNVRSGPGTRYEILSRVVDGEIFYVLTQRGNWWHIRTQDGKHGYMHRSRIIIKN